MMAGSIPVRCTTARTAMAARSSGRTRASAPPCRPIGVRTASMIQASLIEERKREKRSTSVEVDPYALDLGVQIERVLPQLTAEAGLFVTTERRCGVARMIRIHPHRAGFQVAREAMGRLDVARPHPRGEAVDGLVGELDRFFVAVKCHHGEHGAEDLFPCDRV